MSYKCLRLKFFAFTLVAGCVSTSALQAASFTNGSFETPVLPAGTAVSRVTGTTLGSWTASVPAGSDLALVNGPVFNSAGSIIPLDGQQTYGYNGGNSLPGGTIYQDFTTFPGTKYAVSFYVARLGDGGGFSGIQGSAISDPLGSATPLGSLVGSAVSTTFQNYSFNFTASAGTTRLAFADASTATGSVDPFLDNVSVTALPEPSVSIAAAIGMTISLVKRRKRV